MRHKARRRFLFAALAAGLAGLYRYFDRQSTSEYIIDAPPVQPIPANFKLIPRWEWNAREPNHQASGEMGFAFDATDPAWYTYPDPLETVYNTVAIHHSASLLSTNETMRDIQDLHMDTNHWADIGYHYGIDNAGSIYQGRSITVRGASVAGYNTGTIGVVVMGNFEYDHPLDVQLSALQTLVNWLAAVFTLSHLAAHQEFNPESLCPGQNMLPYLDTLAHNAGLQRGTGGHVKPA